MDGLACWPCYLGVWPLTPDGELFWTISCGG